MKISLDIVVLVPLIAGILGIWVSVHNLRKDKKSEETEKSREAQAQKKAEADKEAQIIKMLDNDKKHLEKLDDTIERLTEATDIQGDMIYAMLSHMSTNNNTGGMKAALDKYNAFYRRTQR